MSQHLSYDVLILGAGAAGLSLALRLVNNTDNHVAILCKTASNHSSTYYAQGGIAAVLDDEDSIESHVKDTLIAGSGLCHEDAVEHVVSHSKEVIDWLIELKVPFSKKDDENSDGYDYHLTKEGGHSHRRIIHADDATGKAVATTLLKHAIKHPQIHLIDNQMAIDLIIQDQRCVGAYVLNQASKCVNTYQAKAVVLATGGASKTYIYTTNPHGSSGDGIAMAWRAGCNIANMEFNQFHPTCLYHPDAGPFLITEALRGEGGLLKLPQNGKRFMQHHDKRGELAPRDIVARAIDHEMKRHGLDFVHLDISHKPSDFIQHHFPTIYKRCLELGIDITRDPIPVVPAAHYTCGGIMIDQQGRTDIDGLHAIGECTFTGLHGANRLASNSILECLVYGFSSASDIQQQLLTAKPPGKAKSWDESQVTDPDEKIVISHNWEELRRFMWDYVGIVRTNKRLERALRRIELLKQEVHEYYSNFKINGDLIELRNLILVSELIVLSAMKRHESRGLHFTLDYPDSSNTIMDTVLIPPKHDD